MCLPARDEIEALLELRQQARDLTRVVLEVGVDRDDHVALSVREARRQRRSLAEVPPQTNDTHILLRVVEARERTERSICRAVVDEDRLPRLSQRLEGRLELFEE